MDDMGWCIVDSFWTFLLIGWEKARANHVKQMQAFEIMVTLYDIVASLHYILKESQSEQGQGWTKLLVRQSCNLKQFFQNEICNLIFKSEKVSEDKR